MSDQGEASQEEAAQRPQMAVSSDEVNYLVFRYLQECGFVHSAFTFLHESLLGRTPLRSADKSVPPGALVSFLLRGLQYVDIDDRLRDGGGAESLLAPSAVASLARENPPINLQLPAAATAAAWKARLEKEPQPPLLTVAGASAGAGGSKRSGSASGVKRSAKKQKTQKGDTDVSAAYLAAGGETGKLLDATKTDKTGESTDSKQPAVQQSAHLAQAPVQANSHGLLNGIQERNGGAANHASTDVMASDTATPRTANKRNLPPVDDTQICAKDESVLKLEEHTSEVFNCAWNPIYTQLIATGSGDASARIWQVGGTFASQGVTSSKSLPHGSDTTDLKNKDVTTLEWSPNGELLATGSYDGVARIWSRSGALLHTLRGHVGPIFSLKWNRRGSYLLSGSYDKTTIVWDVSESTGRIFQQFTDHAAQALDVDWKDDETFASCSADKTVQVCKVGVANPIKVYSDHADEVNGVKWDPTGKYLASCSDDCTAKVWEVDSDREGPLYSFSQHADHIYTLKWSPAAAKLALLATASFDGTVMLWNMNEGTRYRLFDRHRDSVYSVAFSPSGNYLASGSLAGQMYIWDIESGEAIKSYKGTGDIFEVSWNKEETRIAGCFSSNSVAVVDFDTAAAKPTGAPPV